MSSPDTEGNDATLPHAASAETLSDDVPRARPSASSGYTTTTLLGRGGMGEVMLAHDARVGRNVALKRLRTQTPSAEALARFLREAKIQARLEHPAILPVYDLGRDADGAPFFTMKRLAGVNLHDRLGDATAPRQALLRAFVDVCLAIDFAHTRGVVHRDLKPSNIMLGDFGEVYVLDWGVARVLGTTASPDTAARADIMTGDDIDTLDSQTLVGSVLGTPGYMPPEQLAGAEVTPAADVYALGSVLFEILAGESLHPRGSAAMAFTLSAPTASPAERAPARDIAPELDAACVAALAAEPSARPSARALADRVQRYLDGDRDVEQRRARAAEELAEARAAVDSGDPTRRADAVAAAGRALALDPTSKPAAELVSSLMLEPPTKMPPELVEELVEVDRDMSVDAARTATGWILAFVMFLPFLAFVHVESWLTVALIYAGVFSLAGLTVVMARSRRPRVLVFLLAWDLFLVVMGRILGPWVIAPGMIAVTSSALVALPDLVDRAWLVLALALATLAAPIVLEATGVLAPTWSIHDGALHVQSGAFRVEGTATFVFLVVAHVAMIVINVYYARSLAQSRRAAHHRAEMHAWHLRKLVPGARRPRA